MFYTCSELLLLYKMYFIPVSSLRGGGFFQPTQVLSVERFLKLAFHNIKDSKFIYIASLLNVYLMFKLHLPLSPQIMRNKIHWELLNTNRYVLTS